jgi:ABC-type uncharacterized transport system permease subunit
MTGRPAITEGSRREGRWEKACLALLAAGSFFSGILTFAGGLGVMMILGDLAQGQGSTLWGWSILGVYASQLVAVLLAWIAYAFDRTRLAAGLAIWPILLGLIILTGSLVQPH